MNASGKQAGATIIAAIVVLVVFAVLGLVLLSMHTTQRVTASDHFSSMRALYLAESGLEWAARELFDAADPLADCEALATAPPTTLGAGSFRIDEAVFDPDDTVCRIVAIGTVGDTERHLTGAVRRAVIIGIAGDDAESIFDNDGAWKSGGGTNINFDNGAIVFSRPGAAGKGKAAQPSQTEATDVITDNFAVGDRVYFVGNFSADGTTTNDTFTIEVVHADPAQSVTCVVVLDTLASPCFETGTILDEDYQVVLFLSDAFDVADITQVRVRVDWSGDGTANEVRLENACIGRVEHCTPPGDGDPIEPDTWEEVREPDEVDDGLIAATAT